VNNMVYLFVNRFLNMYTIIRSSTEGFKNIKSKKYRLQFRCRIVKKKTVDSQTEKKKICWDVGGRRGERERNRKMGGGMEWRK